jgi:hypothetical protein
VKQLAAIGVLLVVAAVLAVGTVPQRARYRCQMTGLGMVAVAAAGAEHRCCPQVAAGPRLESPCCTRIESVPYLAAQSRSAALAARVLPPPPVAHHDASLAPPAPLGLVAGPRPRAVGPPGASPLYAWHSAYLI